ncbi:hypothetical protein HDU98_003560 [Podochytrium sp. JEL0797]|nr:hypothetical protein HDU98_003560 [Podochytrium sp. JEL0797]
MHSTALVALLFALAAPAYAQTDATQFSCLTSAPVITTSTSDYAVTNLPQETDSLANSLRGQYAGYLPTIPRTHKICSFDLVIWLNGGPGCSSLFGSFEETGPFTMTETGSLVKNPNSWHHQANLLYIEQPIGTGFSFNNRAEFGPFTEYQVGSQFVGFLNSFYQLFPTSKHWNLFLTGESYSGVYIPYIGAAIQFCKTLVDGTPIPLKGLGLGNALIDYTLQSGPQSNHNKLTYLQTTHFFETHFPTQNHSLVESIQNECLDAMSSGVEASDLAVECDAWKMAKGWYQSSTGGEGCLNLYNVDLEIGCGVTDQFSTRNSALTAYLNVNWP